jgi:hypothetical protein
VDQQNAEVNSKLSLIQGTPSNVPLIWVRKDIDYKNSNFTGTNRGGEYIMELTYNDTGKNFYYAWEYIDKFLDPVYEVKVDNVAILKIWKNDLDHTKPEFKHQEKKYPDLFSITTQDNLLVIDLKKETLLSQVILKYSYNKGCYPITNSFLETSLDGTNWIREKDWIPFPQVGSKSNVSSNTIDFLLAAKNAKFVRFIFDNQQSCALINPKIEVYTLVVND